MDYNLLICVSEKKWMAIDIDINRDGKNDRISFDGNETVEVDSVEAIDYFCSQILNYYNIDKIDDINLNIKIVLVCDYSEYIHKLFARIKCANNINIIDAKVLFPIIVLKKYDMKNKKDINIKCMDKAFILNINDKLVVSYKNGKVDKQICIEPDDFSILFKFDYTKLISNEDELKIEKEHQLYTELMKKYNELEKSYENMQKQIEDENNKFNNSYCMIHFKLSKLKGDKTNSLLDVTGLFGSFRFLNNDKKYVCKVLNQNESFVKKGMNILEIQVIDNLSQEKQKKYFIEADRDGNVFYTVKNNEYINNGDLVAVLVDPENKRSDMMKTYIDFKTILFGKK